MDFEAGQEWILVSLGLLFVDGRSFFKAAECRPGEKIHNLQKLPLIKEFV